MNFCSMQMTDPQMKGLLAVMAVMAVAPALALNPFGATGVPRASLGAPLPLPLGCVSPSRSV